MTKDEALNRAIEFIKDCAYAGMPRELTMQRVKAYEACKQALDTEQVREGEIPAQKPLSDDEIMELAKQSYMSIDGGDIKFARAIEKAHGIGE
jgi:hypothetical protein